MDQQQTRRDIARRIRRNRVAEGFRNNEELVEAIYTELKVLVDPEILDAIEAARTDCPGHTLAVLAVFYDVSMDELAGIVQLNSGDMREAALSEN